MRHYHLLYNPKLVDRAKDLRKHMTPAERKLWGYLKTFPYCVLRQRPIDHFIADFYCAKLKLVIEVDGAGHFTPEGRARDEARTERLAGYGLRVVRFTNLEVIDEFEGVKERLGAFLVERPPS